MNASTRNLTVGSRGIGQRLASANRHGLELAEEGQWRARQEQPATPRPGVGRAFATYDIPIEDRDEWLAAARRLA
jgi:hypothetical protein